MSSELPTTDTSMEARIEAYMNLAGCDHDEAELHVRRLFGGVADVSTLFDALAHVDPMKRFDNYISCPQNEFPLELFSQIATEDHFGQKYSPIYIYAAVGLGKTHLLSAVINSMEGKNYLFANTAELEVIIDAARQKGVWSEFRAYFKKLDLLCIDDIQLCESSPAVQRELFAIINAMVEEKRIVLISSDVPPTRLKNIEQRLISRLGGGVIVTLSMGDLSYRTQILLNTFPELMEETTLVHTLASTYAHSVRELLAAGRTIQGFIVTHGHFPDLSELSALLGITLEEPHHPAVTNHSPTTDAGRDAYLAKFKEMLKGAESEEEYYLAIQIAINTRLTELRKENNTAEIAKFERATELIEQKQLEEVIQLLGM